MIDDSDRWELYDRYGNKIYMTAERWLHAYEYDEEGDVLDVYFVAERRPAWTIELTPNIMVSIDRMKQQVVSLTFLDYLALIEPVQGRQRSFPVTGLANLPIEEQELVFAVLNHPSVQAWLDISVVENLPDSPITVAHLEPPPLELLSILPVEAA